MELETQWFITGRFGVYYRSNSATRRDAIADHCRVLGREWKVCQKNGDRAIKLSITEPEATNGQE